jgi:hypothetical protein
LREESKDVKVVTKPNKVSGHCLFLSMPAVFSSVVTSEAHMLRFVTLFNFSVNSFTYGHMIRVQSAFIIGRHSSAAELCPFDILHSFQYIYYSLHALPCHCPIQHNSLLLAQKLSNFVYSAFGKSLCPYKRCWK